MTSTGIVAALATAAAFALIVMGVWLLRQSRGNRVKAVLMIVAGAVVAFNAWIFSLPVPVTAG